MGSPLATDSIPLSAKTNMNEKLVVLSTLKDSGPADKAGLKAGDIILGGRDRRRETYKTKF